MEEIKTLNFFGENGITSTSANHVANLAKEYVRSLQEKLASVTFYDEYIKLIGSKEETLIHGGITMPVLQSLHSYVKTIAEAHSLIAFLREAIKEKDRKMQEAKEWENEAERKTIYDNVVQLRLHKPVREPYPTEESIRQTWSVGEQEKYLSLEAEAAALGKFIHEDSPMSLARIDLMRKIENPSLVNLSGSDTIVHSFVPSVALSDVNDVFNELQKKYRSVQAELNGMKKKVEDEISNRKMEIDAAYNAANRAYEAQIRQHEAEVKLYEDERDYKRNELVRQVRDLKIVIPNRLRPIYETLTK